MILKYSCTIDFEYDFGEYDVDRGVVDKDIDFEIGKAIQECITEPGYPVNVKRNHIEFIDSCKNSSEKNDSKYETEEDANDASEERV